MNSFSNREILGLVASTMGIVAYVIYLIEIYRNKIRPHIFSWCLWGVMLVVVWLVQFSEKAGPGAWVTFTSAVFCLIIAVCAWHKGEKNITRSDWISFILGLGSIPLWYVARQPLLAVILLTAIDTVGLYPTIRKSWLKPEEEAISMYAITAAKYAISLFAIERMSMVNWFHPAANTIICSFMVAVLLIGRHVKRLA